MRGRWKLAAAFLAAVGVVGCVVVTGGSGDYSTVSSSQSGSFTCVGAADCVDAGGGSCCVSFAFDGGVPVPVYTCLPTCAGLSLQLCEGNSECTDGGAPCTHQSCRFTVTPQGSPSAIATSIPFATCGVVNCRDLGGS
jgi:hypothetical protein